MSDDDFKKSDEHKLALKAMPGRTRLVKPIVIRRPHISRILDDAYTIIENEMQLLMQESTSGKGMDLASAKKFQIIAQQMAALAREEREQGRDDKLDELSDQDLLSQIDEAKKILDK